jgi:hypothetical protein
MSDKTGSGCVAKPCRGRTPAAFRALPESVLTRNAFFRNSVNRPLAQAQSPRENPDQVFR